MIWLDAQLSPRLAKFISGELGHDAIAVRDLNLQAEEDAILFGMAAKEGVVFISKDKDFAELVERLGPPPHVVWLTCGNTSEERLKEVFTKYLDSAIEMIERDGEPLVEITGA